METGTWRGRFTAPKRLESERRHCLGRPEIVHLMIREKRQRSFAEVNAWFIR